MGKIFIPAALEGARKIAGEIAGRVNGGPLEVEEVPIILASQRGRSKAEYDIVFTTEEKDFFINYCQNLALNFSTETNPNLAAKVNLFFKSTGNTSIKLTNDEAAHLAESLKSSSTPKPDSEKDKLLNAIIIKLERAR